MPFGTVVLIVMRQSAYASKASRGAKVCINNGGDRTKTKTLINEPILNLSRRCTPRTGTPFSD
jgi:hypothetical protein